MSPWLRPLARVARVFPFRMARARRFRGSAFEAVAARTAFDAGVSVGALVIAVAFKTVFIPGSIEFFPAAALPLMFVAAAACTGAYTRLRRARSRRKAVRLAVLVLASSVAGLAAGADGSVAALWALLTIPSVVFPRVLLATTYRDAAMVTRITRAQHGPILLIGGAGYIGSLTVELLLQLGYQRARPRSAHVRPRIAPEVHRPREFRADRRRRNRHLSSDRGGAQHVSGHPSRRARRRSSVRHRLGFHAACEHRRDPDGQRSSSRARSAALHFRLQLFGLWRVRQPGQRRRHPQSRFPVRADEDRQRAGAARGRR